VLRDLVKCIFCDGFFHDVFCSKHIRSEDGVIKPNQEFAVLSCFFLIKLACLMKLFAELQLFPFGFLLATLWGFSAHHSTFIAIVFAVFVHVNETVWVISYSIYVLSLCMEIL